LGISRSDVVAAYRHLLGREPESEDVITAHMAGSKSFDELLGVFTSSDEFEIRHHKGIPVGRNIDVPFCAVNLAATDDQYRKMFDRIAGEWQKFGESCAHWSVLTADHFLPETLNLEHFYHTGKEQARTVVATLRRNGISLGSVRHITDFGCGVGRMTLALCEFFPDVLGVDISPAHLSYARQRADQIGAANASFASIASIEAIDELPMTDLFFSVIVLQHNPPPVMAAMLEKLLSRVNSGGAALFQVPTFKKGYSFETGKYLAGDKDDMEMHVLPQKEVFRIAGNGFKCLEVREDSMTGDRDGVSQTFLFLKQD
jgi:SAM-dependent methyltransferase